MSLQTELEITLRTNLKEKNSLLRKEGNVPGILYGNNEDSLKIKLLGKDLRKALEQPSIFSQIISLKENDNEFKVLLKDVQVNPANDEPIHVDFQRVSGKTKLTLDVPIKYINEESCVGVKNQGGMLSKNKNDIELTCSAENLPEFIEIDCANIELNSAIMQFSLILPEGVELSQNLLNGQDQPVVACSATRATLDIEEEDGILEGEDGEDVESDGEKTDTDEASEESEKQGD
jgi:large subunit ribosomal protein L25